MGRKKPEKYQGFNRIQTCDLRDTGAMLNQLSCEATHWERGQFVEFIGSEVNLLGSYLPVQLNDVKYIISTTAVQIWISYIFPIISLHGKIQPQQIDLAPTQLSWSSIAPVSRRSWVRILL